MKVEVAEAKGVVAKGRKFIPEGDGVAAVVDDGDFDGGGLTSRDRGLTYSRSASRPRRVHQPSTDAKAQFKVICKIADSLPEALYTQFNIESLKESSTHSTASAYLLLVSMTECNKRTDTCEFFPPASLLCEGLLRSPAT